MSKYVFRTVELVKRVYLVEAYSKSEAYDKLMEMEPEEALENEVLGDHIFHEEIINEYEYNKEWKPLDPDIGPDQLKDIPFDGEDYENISYGGTNGDL